MKKKHSNPVPLEIQAEIDAVAILPESEIKTDDVPEVRNWSGAQRGVFYRLNSKSLGI